MIGRLPFSRSGAQAAGRVSLIMLTSGAVLILAWRFGCKAVGWINVFAFALAFLSLSWSVVGAWAARSGSRSSDACGAGNGPDSGLAHWARLCALGFAVLPAVFSAFLLAARGVHVGTSLIFGDSFFRGRAVELDSTGLWWLGALLLSCVVSGVSTRDRRLFVCLMWIVIGVALWIVLGLPVLQTFSVGGPRRTGMPVWIMIALAVPLWSAVVTARWRNRRLRWLFAHECPDRLVQACWEWPGLAPSAVAVVSALIVLLGFLLVVPVSLLSVASDSSYVLAGCAGGLAAAAAFLMLVECWSRILAESAMGLMSLVLVALLVIAVPPYPEPLSARYPSLFCVLMIGFALVAVFWSWLGEVWAQQLDGGVAWTVSGRLIPLTRRIGFFNLSLALVVASLLAVWPRLQGVATTDDTLRSLVLGLGANLTVLLATLRVARKLRMPTFYLLAILAAFSCLGFVLVRALPFSPSFG